MSPEPVVMVGRRRQLEYSTEKKASAPLTVEIFGKLIGFPIKYFSTFPEKKSDYTWTGGP